MKKLEHRVMLQGISARTEFGSVSDMSKEPLTEEAFQKLLRWLNPDADESAETYNRIHLKLTKIFSFHGCREPERRADETFDRILPKIDRLIETYVGDPIHYLRAVAGNLIKEDLRERVAQKPVPPVNPAASDEEERLHNCLDQCMEKLSQYARQLLLAYYDKQGKEKIVNRKRLADEQGITLRALRLRVFHLRSQVKTCMEICLQEADSHETL